MDNSAFRKLMEEARKATAAKNLERKMPAATEVKPEESGPKKKAASKGSERYRRLIEQRARQKDKEIEINRYRDRADERRKEINPDYKNDVQKLLEVDIEKSKYLGGDVEHTHLVKGLDFALLNKVRDEIKVKTDDKGGKAEATGVQKVQVRKNTSKVAKGFKKGVARALSGAKLLPTGGARSTLTDGWSHIQTRTHMGKALLYGMIRGDLASMSTGEKAATMKPNAAVHDAMERMAFEFNLAPDDVILRGDCEEWNELPTTISRSKLDMKDDDECVLAMLEDQLLTKVQTAFISRGHKQKKHRKRKIGENVASTNISESEMKKEVKVLRPSQNLTDNSTSIFGDVGTYVPGGMEGSVSECPPTPPRATPPRDYFNNLRAESNQDASKETDDTDATPDIKRIIKSVRSLASAQEKMVSRKHRQRSTEDEAHAMNGRGRDYGESHDFDFGGEYEDREKQAKKHKTRT